MRDFESEQIKVIDEARKYISLREPDLNVEGWDDDRVFRMINRTFFGGIHRFAQYVKQKLK